jgi:hypothetical protein
MSDMRLSSILQARNGLEPSSFLLCREVFFGKAGVDLLSA